MEFNTTAADWTVKRDGAWLMLKVAGANELANRFEQGKEYVCAIAEKTKKRSLDANAYAWVLLGKIAKKVGIPKEEVYRNYIKDVGDNYEIVPIKKEAEERWVKNWQKKGIGWVCEVLGNSKIEGYVNIINYFGSSTYDSKQMSALINLIVQDCKEQGIETMTPAELQILMEEWN